ncbi:hypothetical protein B9Z55_023671 [Caenorhabditis nigoni]|uniref:RING-type domain-containing protein n=2 Tax=Caenorhabditis nigoni TaxID=1611254 RepID=A0A2G5SR19_9PELO|nr:hypothetical protein B9Z55_023671 [Caenorhabditis nigoni]
MQSDGSGRLIDSRSARQVHWKIFCDKSIETTHIRTVNDTLVVKHRKKAKYLTSLRTSAMQISAYTISYALIYLYDFMEKVEVEDIIYADTDSIVYSIPDGEEDPLENSIGDLKRMNPVIISVQLKLRGDEGGGVQVIVDPQAQTEVEKLKRTLELRGKRMTAMQKRIEILENVQRELDRRIGNLQAEARVHQAVIEGLQEQTNRDADVIDFLHKEQLAYEGSRLCSVCQYRYDSAARTPHVLDCGHAVCGPCLDRLIIPPPPNQTVDLVLRCPVCRKIVYVYPARSRVVFSMIPGVLPVPPRDLDI